MNPVNLEKSCKSCLIALRQRGARDFLVVKVKSLPPDDLVILMSLTRNQHEVAGFSLRYRAVDRLRAISDFAIRLARPLNSLFRVAQYLLRDPPCAGCQTSGSQRRSSCPPLHPSALASSDHDRRHTQTP